MLHRNRGEECGQDRSVLSKTLRKDVLLLKMLTATQATAYSSMTKWKNDPTIETDFCFFAFRIFFSVKAIMKKRKKKRILKAIGLFSFGFDLIINIVFLRNEDNASFISLFSSSRFFFFFRAFQQLSTSQNIFFVIKRRMAWNRIKGIIIHVHANLRNQSALSLRKRKILNWY